MNEFILPVIAVDLENKPKEGYKIARLLSDQGINFSMLSIHVKGDGFGEMRIMTSQFEKARKILMEALAGGRVEKVIAVKIPHQCGATAEILYLLGEKGININESSIMVSDIPGYGCLALDLKKKDISEAVKLFLSAGYNLLTLADLAEMEKYTAKAAA